VNWPGRSLVCGRNNNTCSPPSSTETDRSSLGFDLHTYPPIGGSPKSHRHGRQVWCSRDCVQNATFKERKYASLDLPEGNACRLSALLVVLYGERPASSSPPRLNQRGATALRLASAYNYSFPNFARRPKLSDKGHFPHHPIHMHMYAFRNLMLGSIPFIVIYLNFISASFPDC